MKSTYPRLLILGYALLIGSWVFANPPGAAPDEYAHYIRAVGAGDGQFVLTTPAPPLEGPLLQDKALLWQQQQARMVRVPVKLSPEVFSCRGAPHFIGKCPPVDSAAGEKEQLFRTYVGTYPPFAYSVQGVVMQPADDTIEALMLGRIATAALSLTFIALGVFALWEPGRLWSLLGLIAATTPMVVYVSATLSSSGPEIAAGIGFGACLLRLTRAGDSPKWVWGAAAACGAMLTLSRDLGLVWLALYLAIAFGISGIKPILAKFNNARPVSVVSAIFLAAAAIVAAVWQVAYQAHPETDLKAQLSRLIESLRIQPEILKQQIGIFGPLDTPMPIVAYMTWGILVGSIVIYSLLSKTPIGQKVVLVLTFFAYLAVSAGVDSFTVITAFGVQGRHVLPFAVAIPLLAGEMISRRRKETERMGLVLPGAAVSLAACFHLFAWYTNSRRHSVGLEGPVNFLAEPKWIPPGGWLPWTIAAAAATMLMMSWVIWLLRRRPTVALA